METYSRYVAIILSIILIFLFPLQYIASQQSETADDLICAATEEFAETAKQQRDISLSQYQKLLNDLAQTGDRYEINLEVSHPVTGKEQVTSEVIGSEEVPLQTALVSDTSVHEVMATATQNDNISLMATHSHTDACYAGHRHSTNCIFKGSYSCLGQDAPEYWGRVQVTSNNTFVHIYCMTCNSEIGLVSFYRYFSNDYLIEASPRVLETNGSSYWYGVYTNVATRQWIRTGSGYTENPIWDACLSAFNSMGPASYWTEGSYSGYFKVTKAQLNAVGYHTEYGCPFYNYDNRYSPAITYQPYEICMQDYDMYGYLIGYPLLEDTTPVCNTVVVSLTATNQQQSVKKGESIISTATAVYLDGTVGTVNCSISGYNSEQEGTQTVILSYSGYVDSAKTQGTKSCTVTVKVQDDNIPSRLTITPSSYAVYNGNEPSYSVTLIYTNGTTRILTFSEYSISGWSSGPGMKDIFITYSENWVTISECVSITVLPNLTGISVTPVTQTIPRYSLPCFNVIAFYEDGTQKTMTQGYSTSGFSSDRLGTQLLEVTVKENNIEVTTNVAVVVTKLITSCLICNSNYELDINDTDQGCPVCMEKVVKLSVSPNAIRMEQGESLPVTVIAVYRNGMTGTVTGWTSNYNPNMIGVQNVTINYMGVVSSIIVETLAPKKECPVCGNRYRLNDDGSDPACPLCSNALTGIDVLEDRVIIKKHQTLPITVMAFYLDGHSSVVSDWTSDFIPDSSGTFTVPVYYKACSDYVTVTVQDTDVVSCSFCGLEYDGRQSENGCPICSKTVVGIEAVLRNGSSQLLYKSALNLKVVLKYKDTHRSIIYSGYQVSGYQPDKIGLQMLKVYYNNFSTELSVEIIPGPSEITCSNGHHYYRNEDGSDPGCPYCISSERNGTVLYFDSTGTLEILGQLFRDGSFPLKQGDYLTITIIPKDSSIRSKLKKMFFGTNTGILKRKYTFGGEVP